MALRTLAFCLALAALAAPAHADDVQPLIDEAHALYERADLAGALAKFEEAYARDPRPEILFAMARIHYDRGDCRKALPLYTKFLETKPGPKSTQIATGKVAECQRIIATLAPEPEPAPEPAPATTEPAASPTAPAPAPEMRRVRRAWYTDVLGDALVVGGLAAGGVGTYFWLAARDDADRANGGSGDGVSLDEYHALHDRAERRQTYALVAGGAGVALVAAGILRYALADRTEEIEVAPLTPAGDGDGAGVTAGLQLEVGF